MVVMGDFNEVRYARERFGSVFHQNQADVFNEFIQDSELVDVMLGGYNFTWTDKWASKMSKIDRFLVSESFLEMFVNSEGVVLEKAVPDHRPILLKERVADYGPTPFKLKVEEFNDIVRDTWANDGIQDVNALVNFKN